MRPYREIAALAGLQILCFVILSHLEPSFFLLHFYQTIVYLAVLIMLFYMEDRWAYMIGIVAPALWLVMTFATGLLQGAFRQLLQFSEGKGLSNTVSFLAAISAILSVLMIWACSRRWIREYAGLGKTIVTFGVSSAIVVAYYAIMVIWFWHMVPFTNSKS
jgi:hypothetical protein